MNRDPVRQAGNDVAYIAVVVVNILANVLPFNGQTTAEVANRFPVLFSPAGYVFAIWGVIYLLLAGFTIYQALPSQRTNSNLRRIDGLFILTAAANIAWLFLWHFNLFGLTLLAMFTLLGALIAIYLRLDIGRRPVSPADNWLINVPFSVYLGWITVAAIANVSIALFVAGWDGFGLSPVTWAIIILFLGAGIASVVAYTRVDVAYVLVILWAYAGIAINRLGTPPVAIAAAVAAGVVAIVLIAGWLRRRRVLA